MKIGTDAVLLGSWTDTENAASILDIGTGSGILALMMAQKSESNVNIDAVEIDKPSAYTAENNFKKSPWRNRISVFNMAIIDFTHSLSKKYDLIICNPPFFEDSLLSDNSVKNVAKHNVKLNFKELLCHVVLLLNEEGRFGVIIPYDKRDVFFSLCLEKQLYCERMLTVIPVEGKKPNRIFMAWRKTQNKIICMQNILYIRNRYQNYTEDYLSLTRDFLLKS